jgi:porin
LNGQDTNGAVSLVQGYDSILALKPFNRTELYQLWYRQILFSDKLFIWVGKSVPTDDFNNVRRTVSLSDGAHAASSITGLIYTLIFINPSMFGVIPGYYDSAYGITAKWMPLKNPRVVAGAYADNFVVGVHSGLEPPHFNGYYVYVGGVQYYWRVALKPGTVAVGAWGEYGFADRR